MGQVKDFDFTEDGNSDEFTYNGSKGIIWLQGDFGGGTVTIEASLDSAVWIPDPDFSATTNTFNQIIETFPLGVKFRFVLVGSTTPVLNAKFIQGQGH